jgi:hypothetical protein
VLVGELVIELHLELRKSDARKEEICDRGMKPISILRKFYRGLCSFMRLIGMKRQKDHVRTQRGLEGEQASSEKDVSKMSTRSENNEENDNMRERKELPYSSPPSFSFQEMPYDAKMCCPTLLFSSSSSS